MLIDSDRLKIIIKRKIDSQDISEIKKLFFITKHLNKDFNEVSHTINNLKYRIENIEYRLKYDEVVQRSDLFEDKLLRELKESKERIELLEKNKRDDKSLKDEIKLNLRTIHEKILLFIQESNLNLRISDKEFMKTIFSEEKKFEFEEYKKKSNFMESSCLDDVENYPANIVIKVIYVGEKISLMGKGCFKVYSVTDGRTEKDIYLWNENIDKMQFGKVYAITKVKTAFSTYNGKDILTLSKSSNIEEIQI